VGRLAKRGVILCKKMSSTKGRGRRTICPTILEKGVFMRPFNGIKKKNISFNN